jgi:hypothetical protein
MSTLALSSLNISISSYCCIVLQWFSKARDLRRLCCLAIFITLNNILKVCVTLYALLTLIEQFACVLFPILNKGHKSSIDRVIVICISIPRNHYLAYGEKNCRRGRLRPRQTISRMLNDFAAKVYTTFFVQSNL